MIDEVLVLKLQYITETVDEINRKIKEFENIYLIIKDLENTSNTHSERITRAEKGIENIVETRKRIYERIEVIEHQSQKEKAAIVNGAVRYVGIACLGGVVAFVLGKLGVLFQ
jgi:shikimate kinase